MKAALLKQSQPLRRQAVEAIDVDEIGEALTRLGRCLVDKGPQQVIGRVGDGSIVAVSFLQKIRALADLAGQPPRGAKLTKEDP